MAQDTVDFSLEDLFMKLWGVPTSAFNPNIAPIKGDIVPAASINPNVPARTELGKHGSPYYHTEANGLEGFLPVKITYALSQGTTAEGDDVSLNKVIYLPYCVVGISRKKTFVETGMTERDGTVTELINNGNFEISIKGFLINESNEFPEDDLELLRELEEQKQAVSISNVITDVFLLRPQRGGSDHMLIKNFSMPDLRGVKHVRAYEFSCFSDMPFNLIDIVG